MALTNPPAAPAAPGPAPSRSDRATFAARADAAWSWLFTTFFAWVGSFTAWYGTANTELTALQVDVSAKQLLATTQANIATTQAGTSTTKADEASASASAALVSKNAAALSETNAGASAVAASGSAAHAEAVVAGIGFSDIVFINAAMSPYAVSQATSGKMLACDTSGGAIIITLPQISTLVTPYTVGAKKTTADANSVTINRTGIDTFDDGTTSKSVSTPVGFTLIPDTDTAPDVWAAIGFGGATAGPATGSGLTMGTGKVLGRSTAGTGAIEELDLSTLSNPAVRTPVNASPADAAIGIGETPTLSAGAFYSLYGVAMTHSQWQVSTAAGFSTTVVNTGDVAGTAVSYAVSAGVLAVSTAYYWRARYKDADGVYSAWSTAFSFQTKASFNDVIATPAATPANFGDAFEGGFYDGLFWNELVESSTSMVIGAGAGKVFAVPSMATTPIVYLGQTLEVRSRANPNNKMICTVTGAIGTTLTLNCSSIGGAGTFTDWSIMSRYRSITAPKSTETTLAYKNSNDAAPAACSTLTEGWAATLAMVAAGNATVYPAAWYCRGLTTGGKTDWYLPARDQRELAWRNLKPTADANYVAARPKSAIVYGNLGSYDDGATDGHGVDNNSSPVGAAHTAGDPAQVAAGKNFRTGESEAFAYGSFFYWSASEYSTTLAWYQAWGSSNPGYQANVNKTYAYYARAVRRSII